MNKLLIFVLLVLGLSVPAWALDVQQGSSSYPILFVMWNSDNSGAPVTGLSPTVLISKNGGAFASPSGAVSEVAHGLYKVAGNATDTNTLGLVWLYVTGAGSLPYIFPAFAVVDAPTVQDVVDGQYNELASAHTMAGTYGKKLGEFPEAIAGTAGGVMIAGSNAATTVASFTITGAETINGASNVAQSGDAYAKIVALQQIRTGTAQAGALTTITLDSGASAVNDFYLNDIILITSGTGAGQARFIKGYVGSTKVATVNAWVVTPNGTSVFAVQPFDAVATFNNVTFPKNTVFPNYPIWMLRPDNTGITGLSSASIICYEQLDGGAWALMSNTKTSIGRGKYTMNLTAPQTNGNVVSIECSGPQNAVTRRDDITTQH